MIVMKVCEEEKAERIGHYNQTIFPFLGEKIETDCLFGFQSNSRLVALLFENADDLHNRIC